MMGRTDNTRVFASAYGQKIKYIFQENAGVSSARNTGIKQSKGEWVVFLDSDDEWDTGYLSSQMERASEFPEAIGHITNAVFISADGRRSSLFTETAMSDRFKGQPHLIFRRPLAIIIRYAHWFIQTSVFRRNALLRAGLFDEKLSIAEDLDVIARVAHRGPFAISIAELVAVIRSEETS